MNNNNQIYCLCLFICSIFSSHLNAQDDRMKVDLFLDINTTGVFGFNIENLTPLGDKLVFRTQSASGGIGGIYVSDGTNKGTFPVSNLSGRHIAVANGRAYFTQQISSNEFEILSTDGTQEGTELLVKMPYVTNLHVVDNRLYFNTFEEIWTSDGTPENTILLKTIKINHVQDNNPFLPYKGKLLFHAEDPTHGEELWITDGTVAGTKLLMDVNPGTASSDISYLVESAGIAYFAAEGANGHQLWRTDGTLEGTYAATDLPETFNRNPVKVVTPALGDIFFVKVDLYKYDVEQDTVLRVAPDLAVSKMEPAGDNLFLKVGGTLWVTAGTEATTLPLIASNQLGARELIAAGNTLFFPTDDGIHGQELWTSNGTQAGTYMVKDIYPGAERSYPVEFTKFQGKLFFVAENEQYGREIFYLDYTKPPGITGKVYHDKNQNGQLEEEEYGVSNISLKIMPQNEIVYTNEEGIFETSQLGTEAFQIFPVLENCWELTSDTSAMEEVMEEEEEVIVDKSVNFGISLKGEKVSTKMSIDAAAFRCGFPVPVWLTLRNNGCQPLNGKLVLDLSNLTSFLEADILPNVENNQLSWQFTDLSANQVFRVKILVRVAREEFVGAPILLKSYIFHEINNDLILTDSVHYEEMLRCAIDPNDKLVQPARAEPSNSNFTQFEELLKYTIRFQNTGNDTAFNIQVTDQLSNNFDFETFTPLSASHSYSVELNKSGLLKFYFRNILLPDSMINEPASHGFVSFTILAKEDIEEMTAIKNEANIYFDFNNPILTKATLNTFVATLDADKDGFLFYEDCADENELVNPAAKEIANNGIDEDCDGKDLIVTSLETLPTDAILVHPNPVSGQLNLQFTQELQGQIRLISTTGKLVYFRDFRGSAHQIDVSKLISGIYFLHFQSDANYFVQKIIRQ